MSGGTSTSGSEDVSGTNSQNTASGTQSNSSGGGSSQTGPTAPADGKRIPAAYGTADWKPFGTAAIYSAKAQNTHINNLTPASIESKNGRSHMLVNGKEVAPVSYFGSLMGRYPELTYETYEKMQKVGANYIYVDVHINVSNPNVRYASIKTQLEDVLYAYPDAYLFVRYTPWRLPPSTACRPARIWFLRTEASSARVRLPLTVGRAGGDHDPGDDRLPFSG